MECIIGRNKPTRRSTSYKLSLKILIGSEIEIKLLFSYYITLIY